MTQHSIYDYLQFGNIISFNVYPSAILGTAFNDVRVQAILDKDTANMWIDADSMHINVFPYLPAGVPDNPNQSQFVKLVHQNGNVSIIGIPWIRAETVTLSERGTLVITVDNAGPVDRERIIRALSANGYRAASVSLT